jgi:hypothetical protein
MFGAKFLQTVRKFGPSGFPRGVGDVRIAYDSHRGFGRDQLLLLLGAVDDYVEVDNSVRFIDAFVDGLDLAGAGFARVEAKATGGSGHAPGDLLKLYPLAYNLRRALNILGVEAMTAAVMG